MKLVNPGPPGKTWPLQARKSVPTLQQAGVLTPLDHSPTAMLTCAAGWWTAKSAGWLVPADPSTPPGAIAAVGATAWTGCALLAAPAYASTSGVWHLGPDTACPDS